MMIICSAIFGWDPVENPSQTRAKVSKVPGTDGLKMHLNKFQDKFEHGGHVDNTRKINPRQ